MLAVRAFLDRPQADVFRDGFGERFVVADVVTGQPVQMLQLPHTMAGTPGFELALRQQCARLASFRNSSYVPVYRIDRGNAGAPALVMVSAHVAGPRLSELLLVAETRKLGVDISTALAVVAQLLPAVADLQRYAPDLGSRLIAPERIILGSRARVVVAEQALGAAVEWLHYDRDRLWREFRVAADAGDGPARFTHRTDVLSVGLVALALVLGRPLRDEDFPDRVPALLDGACERSTLGYERPLSPPLRAWLARALHIDRTRPFATAAEACAAFQLIVSAEPLYLASPLTLEIFRESCAAALTALASEARVSPEPVRTGVGKRSATGIADAKDVPTTRPVPAESIHVQMLPPPVVTPPSLETIDWTAIVDQGTAVATEHEIEQLFSDADLLPFGETPGHRPQTPRATRPVDLSHLDQIPAFVEREALPNAPSVQNDGNAAQSPVSHRTATLNRPGRLRKAAMASMVVGLMGGGTMLTRSFGPSMAAWETGTLLVETKPKGLQVLVDGVERGRTPVRLPVRAGEHLLEVRGVSVRRQFPVNITSGVEFSQFLEFETIAQQGAQQSGSQTPRENLDVDAVAKGGTAPPTEQRQPERASSMEARVALTGSTAKSQTTAATSSRVAIPKANRSALAPVGWLSVNSSFPLEVRLNGRVLGTADSERIRMSPGRHDIELVNRAQAYRALRSIFVEAGKVTRLSVESPVAGLVNVNASPWAEVWIGGRRIGETPLANVSVPVGSYEVIFRHPQFGEKRQAISVTAGAPTRVSMDMR